MAGVLSILNKVARLQKLRAARPVAQTPSIEQHRKESTTRSIDLLPLVDWIPNVSPRLEKPVWLGPYPALLDEALVRPLRIVVAAPPQHTKTWTSLHALMKALRVHPGRRHGYATYNDERTKRVETEARRIAGNASVDVKFRSGFWSNDEGGSLIWVSRKGGLTGEPLDGLFLVDDILKDRAEADSAHVRDACGDWFDDVAETRCHRSASIVVMATRWNPDDLSGRLIKRGWPYINLMALAEGESDENGYVVDDPLGRKVGEALWPERRTAEELEAKRRANAYSFASLYQGAPRPRGGSIFDDPTYYDELPKVGYKVAYGLDVAYSEQKYADWSVCIEMWRCGFVDITNEQTGAVAKKPLFYVVGVVRKQVRATAFLLAVHAMTRHRPGPIRWYTGGQEGAIAEFMRAKLQKLKARRAGGDKLQRAQGLAEAWNEGRVLLPSKAALGLSDDDELPEWLQDLIDEYGEFNGVNDKNDDQVDAGAAAFDELNRKNPMLAALEHRIGR